MGPQAAIVQDLTIGFTGTQQGMDRGQLEELEVYLRRAYEWAKERGLRPVFRHGDCVGSDAQAAATARWIGFYVIAHPCVVDSKRAYSQANNEVRLPKAPLERNHDIVDASEYVVATPKETVETVRSGTWATIRYARKSGKPPKVIYP